MQNFAKIHESFLANFTKLTSDKKGKKLIKEYVDAFKKNKDLITENDLFELVSYKCENVDEMMSVISEGITNINLSNLKKGHKILESILEKAGITTEDVEIGKAQNALGFLIENKGSYNNETISNRLALKENVKANTKENVSEAEEKVDVDKFAQFMLTRFNARYGKEMNESEKKLFKVLSGQTNENEVREIYESERKKTLAMLKESCQKNEGDIREKLYSIRENLIEESFDPGNATESLTRLIGIQNTISEFDNEEN